MTTNDMMSICFVHTTWHQRYMAIPCCKRAFRLSKVANILTCDIGSSAGAGRNRYTGYASSKHLLIDVNRSVVR